MDNSKNFEQPYPRPLSGEIVRTVPPALVPSRVDLVGKNVVLEPQNAHLHAKALYRCSHLDETALRIWDYLTYGPWPSEASYLETIRNQSASFDPVFYALRKTDEEQASGQASLMDIYPQNGVIEIGHIWFAPSLQRTRAATEALYLMIKYAMDDLGYRRMQWRCNALNEKSGTAARRLGFRFEGIFYNHLIFKGKNRDTAWYSILDDEWPEVKNILESWLDESNFDAHDQAQQSLSLMMTKRTASQRGT